MLSSHNARLAAARRLTSARGRREAGRFLAEGTPAVREALASGAVVEVFATADGLARNADLLAGNAELLAGVSVDEISAKDAAALSETVTPQGVVAVCRRVDKALDVVLAGAPRLVAVLVEPNEPGNVGAIVRTADAAGADTVIVVGGADVYNGKSVRASAGSLFHVDLVVDAGLDEVLGALAAAGLRTMATSGGAAHDLDELDRAGALAGPTAWLFGSEAHGLPAAVRAAADLDVRVPIYGEAESLNLAMAAGICLYASARAHRHG
jgi:TrmH family RNA methyltransferase